MSTAHDRLGALFLEAVELDDAARAALVARVRTDDPALAAQLVDMLAADDEVAVALRTTNAGAMATTVPAAIHATGAPAIPGFRILGLLGEGGMGAVYAAEQDAPRRPAAVKVLHARLAAARARFVAEAEIMARLDHPGIARVYGAGEADGRLYLAMERVDGATLDTHVASIPLRERLALFAAICDAVHHAHVKGVIHRDLKPSNVMVRTDGRVAVLDFGIARLVGDEPGATRAGELIGTPLYMSPEQARLRPDEVDARSDVYSLGVMLYELCCNALPFDARDRSLSEIARMICDDAPRLLGARDAALRGNLEAVAARALAKSPEDRYPSSAALAEDVRRHLAGHAVLARTPSLFEQVVRFAKRRRLAAALGALAAIATLGFVATITWLWLAASRARDQLAVKSDETLLREARGEVARDPAAALRALGELSDGADAWRAWATADEARGRGIASETLRAHASEVRWLEPIGDAVVTAGFDGRARLWPAGATEAREIAASTTPIHVVRARPDGRAIAIGGGGGVLRVVAPDGRALGELAGHTGNVKRAEWSADGAWLATADSRGGVWLWPAGAAPGRAIGAGTDEIESLAIAADGSAVVAGDVAGHWWWWSTAGAEPKVLANGGGRIVGAWVGREAAAAVTSDGRLLQWSGERVDATELGATCRHAAFSADGRHAVIAADGAVLRIDDAVVSQVGALDGHVRVAIAADGRRAAAGADGGALEVWDRATGRALDLHGHADRIRAVAFARGGDELYTGDLDGVVQRWQLDAIGGAVQAGPSARAQLAVAGDRLVALDGDGALWMATDVGGGRELGRAPAATAFAAWPGGVATADPAGKVTLWSDPVAQVTTGVATALAVDPHGAWLATAGRDGPVRVWRLPAAPAPLVALDGPTAATRALAAAGDHLAAGGDDGEVRVWTHLAPASRIAAARHAGGVTALAFDPSGTWLASTGRDHRIARVRIGRAASSIAVPDAVASLAIAPDGTVLAATRQHVLVRWPPDAGAPIATRDGVLAVVYVPGPSPHWAAALADGAIVQWRLEAPSIAALRASLSAAAAP